MGNHEYDPIEAAYLKKERDERTAGLFHPIYKTAPHEPNWIIEGWIPEGYLVFLAAGPKKGKTCLATQLALSVATGTPFAGIPTHQTSVLWLAQEEGPLERNLLIDSNPLAQTSTPLYTCYEHLPIDQPDSLDALTEWIKQTDAKLIIVDPLHGASSGRSLSDAWRARKTLKALKVFCTLHNVTTIVLHHSKNPTKFNPNHRVAENDQLAATASMQIVLTTRPSNREKENARLITLHCEGRGSFANRTIHLLSTSPSHYEIITESDLLRESKPANFTQLELQLLELLGKQNATSEQLCDALHANPGTLRNAVTRLRARGLITIISKSSNENLYGVCEKHE